MTLVPGRLEMSGWLSLSGLPLLCSTATKRGLFKKNKNKDLYKTKERSINPNKSLNSMKRLAPEWEKIFVNHGSAKRLQSKICKMLSDLEAVQLRTKVTTKLTQI